MAYLPTSEVAATQFPLAWSKDLAMQTRLQAELYRRKFPRLPYYRIRNNPTPASIGGLSGAVGTTKIDSLHGEAIDPGLTVWRNPHQDPTTIAANPAVYAPPVELHMRVQRVNRRNELQKQGFDRVRTLKAYIPAVLLDEAGVRCAPGDYFRWDAHEYTVLQESAEGYWKNTNLRTIIVLECESRILGS